MNSTRELGQRPDFRLGPQLLWIAAFICLASLAINAVIIQTIVPDEDSPLKSVVRIGVLALAGFAIFTGRVVVPQWILLLALFSFILMVARGNTDQLSYVFVLVLVPLLWSIPDRRLLGLMALASLASLALIFALLQIGLTHNETLEFRNRATYGTKGVPFFFNVVYGAASLSVLYVWKYRRRMAVAVIPISLVVVTYLYRQTDARGGYLAFLAFLVLLVVVPAAARFRFVQWMAAAIPVLCIAASVGIASLSRSAYYDELLSYRPTLLNAFLDNIGLTDILFSTSVKNFSDVVVQVRTVDNSFLHLLVGGGLVMTIAFCCAFASSMMWLAKSKAYSDIAFLVATALYFNSESILLRIENLFAIYAWYLVLRNCAWTRQAIDKDVAEAGRPAITPLAPYSKSSSRLHVGPQR